MNLSVVIPVRNVSALLDECLQAFHPRPGILGEIVVVDCCSTDGIEAVLARHATALPLIHVREPDRGIYDAFNKGARIAAGPLLFFMGADDRVTRDLFEAAASFPNAADILVGGITTGGVPEHWSPGLSGARLLFRNIPHQGMLIRRQRVLDDPYSLDYALLSDYAWNIAHFWRADTAYCYTGLNYCEWAPGGVSTRRVDEAFVRAKADLVRAHAPAALGRLYSLYRRIFRRAKP